MSLILNIGLIRQDGTLSIDAMAAVQAYFTVVQHAVQQSDTEPTLVVEVERRGNIINTANAIFILAELLDQECIAVYNCSSQMGALIGPKADKWGAFNPDYFVMLDGSRMSNPDMQAAA